MTITSPTALDSSVDIDRLAENVAYYSNGRFYVEIFGHGTCVFPSPHGDREGEAKDCLRALPKNNSFEVREMDDGNFVVKFTEEVFAVVFKDEFQELSEEVYSEINSSTSPEKIAGRSDSPEVHMFIGLFARTRLIGDREAMLVVREVSPVR